MGDAPPDVTLTAGASGATRASAEPATALVPGTQIGRYRLLRILGSGGMGVVWAAHDPDLDREVALKVLRHDDAGPAQRARLLREARAMAKVRHPNVIMVHEVGTADGRDFVAMEIVRGRTVAQWLGATPRPPRRDVARVLRDAGRGLAAAHAAGLVHRDFKPHNVLIDDDGGVIVTDFGLARSANDPAPAAGTTPAPRPRPRDEDVALNGLEQTVAATPRTRDLATLDAALTEAGALLGTPAYMAPEQFDGAAAGPRADQFAYCVAVWEAATGARPFTGATVAELRAAIDRGAVGGGALSRGARAALRRGLAPDPARRWPDMNALLHALERSERRRYGLIAGLVAAGLAAAVALIVWRGHGGAAGKPCELALQPGLPGRLDVALAAREPFDRFEHEYRPALKAACERDDEPMLGCLSGEAVTTAVVVAAANQLAARGVSPDIGAMLPAVSACYAQPMPSFPDASKRLGPSDVAARVAAAAVRMRSESHDVDGLDTAADLAVEIARKSTSCVALAEAQIGRAEALTALHQKPQAIDAYDEAAATAEQCHHDRARAEAMLGRLELALGHEFDRDRIRTLRASADAAVDRAGRDPILRARLELCDAVTAWIDGHLDEAIDGSSRAVEVLEQRSALGLTGFASQMLADSLVQRGGRGDVARAQELVARVAQTSTTLLGEADERTRAIQRVAMTLAWKQGDRAAVDAIRARIIAHPSPDKPAPGQVTVTGMVVDEQGHAVAGADVVAGAAISGDDRTLDLTAGGEGQTGAARSVTSGADGSFAIVGASPASWVIAQTADGRRSPPAPAAGGATLRVGPTTRVTGHVDLRAHPASAVIVDAVPVGTQLAMWSQVAPVAADGTFVMDRLPRGRWSVRIREERGLSYGIVGVEVKADRPEVGPLELAMTTGGATIDIVVRADRDTVLPLAQIYAVPGRSQATSLATLLSAARAEPTARSTLAERVGRTDERVGDVKVERGDLRATLTGVPAGEATICVMPLGSDSIEPAGLASLYLYAGDVDVHCKTITADPKGPRASLLFVVPPMKRIP